MDDLKQLLTTKHDNLSALKDFYAYMSKSNDLEDWINTQLLVADSDDYGTDFDHLSIVMTRWDDFRGGSCAVLTWMFE